MLPACLLALIAGYADTIGYIRYEAFAGLMTGNTIFFGLEVARGQWLDAAFHAAIMAAFLAGVILSRVMLRLGAPVWSALGAAAILLVITGLLGKREAALLLPLAMGMQNSAANRFNGVALNTVFITGNIQKVGEGLLAWLWPSKAPAAPKSDGVAIFALVWFGYALGAGLGALANQAMSQPLLIPAAILPFIMYRIGGGRPSGSDTKNGR